MKKYHIYEESYFGIPLYVFYDNRGLRYAFYSKDEAIFLLDSFLEKKKLELKNSKLHKNPCRWCRRCFFYQELKDMGASIPHCSIDKKFTMSFPYQNLNYCRFYITYDKAWSIILKNKKKDSK